MFAILKTGGKQYTVAAGDIVRIEKLEGEAGKVIELSELMLINDGSSTKVGTPLLSNSSVKATILDQTHNKTVIVYKKKRRQGYDRKNGHRQLMSVVHIDELIMDGKSIAKATAPAPKAKAQVVSSSKKAAPAKIATKAQAKPVAAKTIEKKAAPAKAATPKPEAEKFEEKKVVATKPAAKKPAAKKPAAKKTKE
jgi:large subunit ribosomal protein L21